MACCRSALSKILAAEGFPLAAELFERIAEDEDTFEFRSKRTDVGSMAAEVMGITPDEGALVATLVLSIFDGPRDLWAFDAALPLLTRNAAYASLDQKTQEQLPKLKNVWDKIQERVLQ